MEHLENKSREKAVEDGTAEICECCQRFISFDEKRLNEGFCDQCRSDKNDSVVQYAKEAAWDKNGRKDEDLRAMACERRHGRG